MARTRIFVPRETTAISVGADDVALAVARISKKSGTEVELIRNGSWGASWLEPLVEVEVDGQRIAYGNVDADDVAGLFDADFLNGGDHASRLGPVNEIPYLVNQDRWTAIATLISNSSCPSTAARKSRSRATATGLCRAVRC